MYVLGHIDHTDFHSLLIGQFTVYNKTAIIAITIYFKIMLTPGYAVEHIGHLYFRKRIEFE